MSRKQLAIDLAERTRKFTRNLLSGVPFDRWYEIPAGIDTSIAWQVGHLLMSQNYHCIRCISGLSDEVMESVPLREYVKKFAMGTTPAQLAEDPVDPELLLNQMDLVHRVSMETLAGLSEKELDEPVIPGKVPHPVANTKLESITWGFEHESWHAGQIAMIGRGLGLKLSIKGVPKT